MRLFEQFKILHKIINEFLAQRRSILFDSTKKTVEKNVNSINTIRRHLEMSKPFKAANLVFFQNSTREKKKINDFIEYDGHKVDLIRIADGKGVGAKDLPTLS